MCLPSEPSFCMACRRDSLRSGMVQDDMLFLLPLLLLGVLQVCQHLPPVPEPAVQQACGCHTPDHTPICI